MMDDQSERLEIIATDRYAATGTPYPDPATVCRGPCEGMGCYPRRVDDTTATAEERRRIDAKVAAGEVDEIGYVFIICPSCEGSGRRRTQDPSTRGD